MKKSKKNVPKIRFKGYSEEWVEKQFSSTFSPLNNNTLSRAELNYEKGSTKNVHYGDVLIKFGECLDVLKEELPYITNEKIADKYTHLQDGDIVIADAAEDETVGKCTELLNVINEGVVAGLHTIACRPLFSFANGYLGYFLNSPVFHNQLLPLMQGTKVVGISKSAIKDTFIYYPEFDEQKQIGNYFQNIDKLIEANQNKLDKLKNIKKASLEKMFPKKGTTVPEIRFKGFRGKWEEKELGELSEPLRYGLNAASTTYDGINKYIRITDIDDETHVFDYKDLTSPNTNLSVASDYQLKDNDILFARTGASVGKTYLYKKTDGIVYYAGFLIRARIKIDFNSEFIFQNTLTTHYHNFVKITSQRSGQPGVNAQEYSSWSLTIPKMKDEQKKIGNYFQNLDNLICKNEQQLIKLKNIKKACLEKMFVNKEDTL